MTLPGVTITELDGALGVLPPTTGKMLAVVGVTDTGPVATPAAYGRVTDLVADFGAGPGVESAARYIQVHGRPVLFTRVAASDNGSVGAVTSDALGGTSVVTIATSPTPNDDYEFLLKILTDGTVGTAGITAQISYDGGRSFGPAFALGTAVTYEIPGAGGVSFAFAVGTLKAGATYAARATAPAPDATTLATALTALGATIAAWEIALMAFPLIAATFDAVETAFASFFTRGKYCAWVGNTRIPNAAESESSYKTALDTIFSAKTTKTGSLYGGALKVISSVSGRQYRRPVAFVTGALEQSVSEEIDIADVNLGGLIGVSIRDANGNPDEHDESINPGLDDSRFATLRTWDGLSGVYVTRPRLFSAEGSDFQLMPHRRVLNLAHAALRMYFIRRLNKPIRVDRTSGLILESEALEIEAGATAAMSAVLMAKPKASGVQFVLSRFDNVLSTKTLTGTARVIPLAYPEYVNLEVGFYNPAITVQAA
jgi:hypothetical protein